MKSRIGKNLVHKAKIYLLKEIITYVLVNHLIVLAGIEGRTASDEVGTDEKSCW
jgi:hypothetical protein